MKEIRLAFLIIIFIISVIQVNVFGQKNIEDQSLLWSRYSLEVKLEKDYRLRQEIEERAYWFPWRQHQFVSRTQLDKKIGAGWNAGIGFTYFLQSLPHDPKLDVEENRTELRPQVELSYTQNLNEKWKINHRFWSEFRFFEQTSGFEFSNNRTRYKLELRYTPVEKLTIKAFDEIHVNIGQKVVHNVFDQNRYGASLQYMPFRNFGVELGYFNWFQQRSSGVDFYNRNIFRLTLHHKIDLT